MEVIMANQSTQSTARINQAARERRAQDQGDGSGNSRGAENEGQGMFTRGRHQMDSMVQDHEAQSLLIALVAGFGVGYLIGCSLASDRSTASRWPEWADRHAAEGIGRRVMESLERVLPDAISSRFSS
jgi:hypothetical protein